MFHFFLIWYHPFLINCESHIMILKSECMTENVYNQNLEFFPFGFTIHYYVSPLDNSFPLRFMILWMEDRGEWMKFAYAVIQMFDNHLISPQWPSVFWCTVLTVTDCARCWLGVYRVFPIAPGGAPVCGFITGHNEAVFFWMCILLIYGLPRDVHRTSPLCN